MGNNTIVEYSLKIWREVVKKYDLAEACKLLVWPSETSKFGPGRTDRTFKSWSGVKQISALCKLMDGNTFKSFQQLKDEFDQTKTIISGSSN